MPQRKPKEVAGAGLDQGQQRILRWLERYPFQRAQDLVVALAPWEGRGAVYRRIADLRHRQLIESVRMGAVAREELYHLSPIGIYTCALLKRESGQAVPLVLREAREKLVRVLPRVPVWLMIQDLVNSLVLGATQALLRTESGAEATMVRWNWVRDYTHRFVARGSAERMLRVRTDGALALCFRAPSSAHLEIALQESWQTFFLLYCPLDERHLLKNRLDRLVRWRESAERWSVYSQMPPVLILATTPRQAEWWQLACAHVTTQLQVSSLVGAIASLPEDQQVGDGWRLAWRTLGTNASCHLRDLIQPGSVPALPELGDGPAVRDYPNHQEATQVWCVPPFSGRRSYALMAHAQAVAERVSDHERFDYRLFSLFLTRRQWDILALCFAHPLLERDELSILLSLRPKPVQILLADLAQKGFLIRTETACGGRWHLTEAGLRLLARRASCQVSRLVRQPILPDVPLQQRGVAGLLHQIRHTAGIYAFFTELLKSLATNPETYLRWWETGGPCEHVFLYREQTFHFKPDALACVQLGARTMRFWLEWDRGTMGVRDLEQKCATYAAYLSSREWARMGSSPPAMVYIAPEIAQERRFVKTASALLAHLPELHLYTTTASLIALRGVLAPIWQQALGHVPAASFTAPEHAQRVALFAEE
ncbi:MAG: replication-relaxation family protein [Ktedonobacteraceae bacterium]